jgi:peptide/nickel transport system permease protein
MAYRVSHLDRVTRISQKAITTFKLILQDRSTRIYFGILVLVITMGVLGPMLAPYHYETTFYNDDESIYRNADPTMSHPLGTTNQGYDVLSRLLYGARPTVIAGLVGGLLIAGIGATIGVTAGYMGGLIDSLLMRFTDMMYTIPVIPFAMVILAFVGVGFLESIVVIGAILWRGNARVIRSQVLQIKEQSYILALQTNGASHFQIALRHVSPNVAPMAILFFAMGVGLSILIQANLAFLGLSNPFLPSWGVMVRAAYDSGQLARVWWWSLPPGFLIALTVLSTFMVGRNYETLIEQSEGEDALARAG